MIHQLKLQKLYQIISTDDPSKIEASKNIDNQHDKNFDVRKVKPF